MSASHDDDSNGNRKSSVPLLCSEVFAFAGDLNISRPLWYPLWYPPRWYLGGRSPGPHLWDHCQSSAGVQRRGDL